MARCLLSGHNPRETFGLMYPLTADYFSEFMGRRQYETMLRGLAGPNADLDLSVSAMVVVQGYLYVNVSSMLRNMAPILPVDPASVGAPAGLVTVDTKPRLATRLLLPFRGWRVYRETARTNRVVSPRYRTLLNDIYWQLRSFDPERPGDGCLAAADPLFEPSTVADAIAFLTAYNILSAVQIAVSKLVSDRAPDLLNLLVGHGTSTALLGTRMWELGQVARQCGPETVDLLLRGEGDLAPYRKIPAAGPLLEGLERLMRTYGHRAFQYSSDFDAVRLADQPGLVLLALGGLLRKSEPPAARAAAAQQVGLEALRGMNPLRRFAWRQLLRLGSALIGVRERGRDTLELQNAAYGLAARLLSRHYFPDQPPDYLWLYTFEELLSFGQSRGRVRVPAEEVAGRQAELERNRLEEPPPELIWYDPESKQWWPVQEEAAPQELQAPGVRLQGIGASAGSGPVEGMALVTNSAKEAAERLLNIEGPVILVTHVTDPVWSSLFSRLTAVVTEMGGIISHAAIVARENGIPAVVSVPNATQLIRDGQQVRVDGAAGLAEVLGESLPC